MNWPLILTAMLPEHLLLAGMLAILGLEIRSGRSRDGFGLALLFVGAAAAAALWLYAIGFGGTPFPGHFSVVPTATLPKAVLLALALPVLLISRDDFAETPYYTLVLASLYGACLVISSDSFPTLFLGIEIMSLPVYALVVLGMVRTQSAEAALKYLVLGGAATATLLMGVAFLYGWSGSLAMEDSQRRWSRPDPLAPAGVALVTAALFLKAAVVPLHAWRRTPTRERARRSPLTSRPSSRRVCCSPRCACSTWHRSCCQWPGSSRRCHSVDGLGNLRPCGRRVSAHDRLLVIDARGLPVYTLLGAKLTAGSRSSSPSAQSIGLMNILAFTAHPPGADNERQGRLGRLPSPVSSLTIAPR